MVLNAMRKTKQDYYDLVKDLISKEDFEKEIQKKSAEFSGLINADAIAFMIVDELGRNPQPMCKISELKEEKEFTGYVVVDNIYDYRKFQRKNGSFGRVVNLEIKDETGSSRLVLWDKDVDLVANDFITKNTVLKIINGRVKSSPYGLEINIGRDSMIVIEPEEAPVYLKNIIFTKIKDKSKGEKRI